MMRPGTTEGEGTQMSYLVAPGLLASNCLKAMRQVLPIGSRETPATSATSVVTWLSDGLSTETRYGKPRFRFA
jgi:hypothetical protein